MVKTLPYNAGGAGLIPGQRAKIPHVSWTKKKPLKHEKKKIQKQYCYKFNKDFKKTSKNRKAYISSYTHTHTHSSHSETLQSS